MLSLVLRNSLKSRALSQVRSISTVTPRDISPATASSTSSAAGLKTAASSPATPSPDTKHVASTRGLISANRSFHAPSAKSVSKKADLDTDAAEAGRLRRNRDARQLM